MKQKIIGVYAIQAPDGRLYIGSSVNVKKRWSEHKSRLLHGKHDNPILSNLAAEVGVESLRFRLLLRCFLDDLRACEQAAIDRMKPALNILPTAERLLTEQWKRPGFRARNTERAARQNAERWSDPAFVENARARVAAMQTTDIKEKAAASRRRVMKERGQAYRNVAEAATATLKKLHAAPSFAAAHSERMRENMKRLSQDPEFQRKRNEAARACHQKKIRCITTGEVFPSRGEAAKAKGISESVISKQLRGLPTRSGLEWEYLNG